MTNDKLEPRLVTFLEQQRTRATARGGPAAAMDDVPIEVTISHVERLEAEETGYEVDWLADANAEHHLSPRMIDALAEATDDRDVDPQGKPIPQPESDDRKRGE